MHNRQASIPMSGSSFVQIPRFAFNPSETCFAAAHKPSMEVKNGSFWSKKYRTARTTVRAEVGAADHRKGEGQGELTIPRMHSIEEVVMSHSQNSDGFRQTKSDLMYLEKAYETCRIFCAKHSKSLELATWFVTKERRRALWALYAWCRRLDDLADSPEADCVRAASLDQWEKRTEDIFNGHPHDMLDAALVDTISKFRLDIKPFQEMIKGMRMDTMKTRYANFEELFLYSFYVAGTVGLMIVPVIGINPESTVASKTIYDGAVYLCIAGHLTDVLRDVSEDAQLGRVYLPQDELAQFGLSDEDIYSRKVSDGWKEFMKMQIQRARYYFDRAEQGVSQFDKATCWKVKLAVQIYKQALNAIEINGYDNLTNKPMGFSV